MDADDAQVLVVTGPRAGVGCGPACTALHTSPLTDSAGEAPNESTTPGGLEVLEFFSRQPPV
jgi:hypothetical protein